MALGFRCCCGEPLPTEDCVACTSGKAPFCWKVTISGMEQVGGAQGNVNNVNGVHYLTWQEGQSECTWRCRHILTTSGGNTVPMADYRLFFFEQSLGNYQIVLQLFGELLTLNFGITPTPVRFIKEAGAGVDCSVSHELTWIVGGDGSNATCTIEPVDCLCQYPHITSGACWCSKCGACKQGTDDNITGFRVVVAGLADAGGCPGSELNGTYDFDWPWDAENDEPADPSESDTFGQDGQTIQGCWGNYISTSIGCTCGSSIQIRFRITRPVGMISPVPARIEFIISSAGFAGRWIKDLGLNGELIDCQAIEEEMDNSHFSLVGFPTCTLFDATNATVTVTPITA